MLCNTVMPQTVLKVDNSLGDKAYSQLDTARGINNGKTLQEKTHFQSLLFFPVK